MLNDSSLFKMVRQPTRPEERVEDLIMVISFEMDLNLYSIERAGYNILDLLSNIGGIQGLLLSFFGVLISAFNYNNFDNITAAQFYKLKARRKGKESSFFIPTKCGNIIDYFLDLLPKCIFRCCEKSRK